MTTYRSRKGRQRRQFHRTERSWWNPRRWLAMPLVVGTGGALATIVCVVMQNLGQGFLPWGALALVGTLAYVGAIAWAQSDLNELRNREKRRNR